MVLERAKGLVPVFCLWIGCCCCWLLRDGNDEGCCWLWVGERGKGEGVVGAVENIGLMVVVEGCGNDEVVVGA